MRLILFLAGQKEASLPDNSAKKDYELLREDFPNYDLSFKVIVIGNSGNYILYL